jgi:hypothetical protein
MLIGVMELPTAMLRKVHEPDNKPKISIQHGIGHLADNPQDEGGKTKIRTPITGRTT